MTHNFFASRHKQGGAALAVVLIMLLVLILLGLASIRGTLLEQYMSTSEMDRSLSFQATEAALREGEALAATKPTPPGSGCTGGVCAAPTAGQERWLDTDPNWTAMSLLATPANNAVTNTATPRFIVEVMAVDSIPGTTCTTSDDLSPDAACTSWESRYRITARSVATGRSEVLLQSNLAVP